MKYSTKYPYHQTYYRQESHFYNRYTIFAHQVAVHANWFRRHNTKTKISNNIKNTHTGNSKSIICLQCWETAGPRIHVTFTLTYTTYLNSNVDPPMSKGLHDGRGLPQQDNTLPHCRNLLRNGSTTQPRSTGFGFVFHTPSQTEQPQDSTEQAQSMKAQWTQRLYLCQASADSPRGPVSMPRQCMEDLTTLNKMLLMLWLTGLQ